MKVNWKVLDNDYLNFARTNYEHRIPHSDYGKNKYKPFFGSLFEIGDLVYVTQVSHPQQRHDRMKPNLDFYKIYSPTSGKLIAVVNLNYMFPIHTALVSRLDYKNLDAYRNFASNKEKDSYIALLETEIKEINKLRIVENAKKLYEKKYLYPDSSIARRSLDFKKLEQACYKKPANLNG